MTDAAKRVACRFKVASPYDTLLDDLRADLRALDRERVKLANVIEKLEALAPRASRKRRVSTEEPRQ